MQQPDLRHQRGQHITEITILQTEPTDTIEPIDVVYENQTLSKNLEKHFLNTKTADIYFTFADGDDLVKIPAHKTLLAAQSDAFMIMFYGEWKVKDDVRIEDVPVKYSPNFCSSFIYAKLS